jgi:hypothetical protein
MSMFTATALVIADPKHHGVAWPMLQGSQPNLRTHCERPPEGMADSTSEVVAGKKKSKDFRRLRSRCTRRRDECLSRSFSTALGSVVAGAAGKENALQGPASRCLRSGPSAARAPRRG